MDFRAFPQVGRYEILQGRADGSSGDNPMRASKATRDVFLMSELQWVIHARGIMRGRKSGMGRCAAKLRPGKRKSASEFYEIHMTSGKSESIGAG
ncbi:MAG: hypothetical protein KAH44_08210, partial [Oricola sp.]|nr:hypothetical protein [Oricola sp.]